MFRRNNLPARCWIKGGLCEQVHSSTDKFLMCTSCDNPHTPLRVVVVFISHQLIGCEKSRWSVYTIISCKTRFKQAERSGGSYRPLGSVTRHNKVEEDQAAQHQPSPPHVSATRMGRNWRNDVEVNKGEDNH